MTLALVVGAAPTVLGAGLAGDEQGASVKAWGQDDTGQLGDGMPVTEESRTPVSVSGISCAVSAAAGGNDSFAVLKDGSVEAWGADEANKSGKLGDGGALFPYSTTPVPVEGISTATEVAADNADVYALLSNGTIVGWGDNRYGQFGNGEEESESGGSNTPVRVASSLSTVKALATSDIGATLALLNNGEVDSWGDAVGNDTLGRGGSGFTPAPVDISGTTPLTGATAVGEGAIFSLALVGGEVKAWGDVGALDNSALGAGPTATPGIVPVTVGGASPLEGVSAIAAGGNFALALVGDEVKAWGSDQLGQLGNGESGTTSNLPVTVKGLKGIVAIAAAQATGYALDSQGRVWAWGNNTQGELGTGAIANTADEPVQITALGSGNAGLAADGVDAEHALALGPSTTTCGSGSGGTETTTSSTSSNPGTRASSSSSTTSSTEGSPQPASTASVAQLALGCTDRKLALTDVVQRGGRVLLSGAAVSSLAGHKVKILFDGRSQVASATVAPNGLFSASAPQPPAKLRGSNSARYLAESGSLKSLDLKLTRRLILDPPSSSASKITLAGEVSPPLAKPIAEIVVSQQLSCTHSAVVARFKPSPSGRFRLTIRAPSSGRAALYRLSTKVRGSAHSNKLFSTFSLPEPVSVMA